MDTKPGITIEYCTQCRWLLRAAWTAQELLTTFETELGGVTLVPGTGGVFKRKLLTLIWADKPHCIMPPYRKGGRLVAQNLPPLPQLHSKKF